MIILADCDKRKILSIYIPFFTDVAHHHQHVHFLSGKQITYPALLENGRDSFHGTEDLREVSPSEEDGDPL